MLQCEILIPDVSYDGFMGVLHYIYTNSIPQEYDTIALTQLWRGEHI